MGAGNEREFIDQLQEKEGAMAEGKPDVKFGWEDCGCALVKRLICSCGTDLIKGYTDYVVNGGELIECLKCKKAYQFVWVGMTIKEGR